MDAFGKLNPRIMDDYQKDYIDKRDAEYEKINYSAWLNGRYMISAIQVGLQPKKAKYPDKPFGQTDDEPSEANVIIQSRKFEDWANSWNKKFEQKQPTKAPD